MCTGDGERPGFSDRLGRCDAPLSIAVDDVGDGDIAGRAELVLASSRFAAKECAVNPPPFHAREVVHDTENGDELPVGSPASLRFAQPVELLGHGAPKKVEPRDEQLGFVS